MPAVLDGTQARFSGSSFCRLVDAFACWLVMVKAFIEVILRIRVLRLVENACSGVAHSTETDQ
jgi:hypothetical protein